MMEINKKDMLHMYLAQLENSGMNMIILKKQ